MNVKNEYTCKVCKNKDIIEFEGFSPLYIARCSVCGSQSILSKENVSDKPNNLYIFVSKADRMKDRKYNFNKMLKFTHYRITKI